MMSNRLAFSHSNHLRSAPLKAFKSEEAAFRAGAWFLAINGHAKAFDWCEKNGLAPRDEYRLITRAQVEGVNTSGGVLVPPEIMRAIISLREIAGTFRANADVRPMASDSADIPQRSGGLTAYFTTESATINESSGIWSSVGLSAKKLATFTRTSSELNEDSAIDLGDWFASEIAYAFASKEDACGWNGDATSTYSGISGVTFKLIDGSHNASKIAAASGHDTFAEIDATDLANLIAALPSYALPGAKWFVSSVGFALAFCRLAAAAGGFTAQTINGRNVPGFLGFPVALAPSLPTSTSSLNGQVMLAFGDLALAATLGERRGVTVARSDHRYFDADQVGWRGTERVDIVVHDLGDNTTAGSLVGLIGN